MQRETYLTPEQVNHLRSSSVPEVPVWSTSEQSRLRALSLYIIRSIVEKHGGTMEVDLATDTINIEVPKEEQVPCAQEIEAGIGDLCGL